MSSNPFEDDERPYPVPFDADCRHSLWPVDIAAPDVRRIVPGPDPRAACLRPLGVLDA